MAKKKPDVELVVKDNHHSGKTQQLTGNGCLVVVFEKDKKEITGLTSAVIGDFDDYDMLIMLRFLVDKVHESLEDPALRERDIDEVLSEMRDNMLAKGKEISEGTLTVQ